MTVQQWLITITICNNGISKWTRDGVTILLVVGSSQGDFYGRGFVAHPNSFPKPTTALGLKTARVLVSQRPLKRGQVGPKRKIPPKRYRAKY